MSNNKNLRKAIENTIGVPTSEIQRKATEDDVYAANFTSIINTLEELRDREMILLEYGVNSSEYNSVYYTVINKLMEITFPIYEIRSIIYYYIYERFDENGEVRPLEVEGFEYILSSPLQLLHLIKNLTQG